MENLTREKALELHRQMWSDMREALGDNPNRDARWQYKDNWIAAHFPNERVYNDCFLCEYCANHQFYKREAFDYDYCKCPIEWPFGRCEDGGSDNSGWDNMPISQLLALPERYGTEVEEWEVKE